MVALSCINWFWIEIKVGALEAAVDGGTIVAVKEFDMTAELLMRQLLKLDGIKADGEARLQRKAEVSFRLSAA